MMKTLFFLLLFMVTGSAVMAESSDGELIQKIQMLPDFTAQAVLSGTPSVLLSSPYDRRIDRIAGTKKVAFKIHSESTKAQFLAIVDPHRTSGWWWWRKPERIVFEQARFEHIAAGKDHFTEAERIFLQTLP